MITDPLTTEKIRKLFKNNFDLCNYAIEIARNMIREATPASLGEILENVQNQAEKSKDFS